MPPEKKKKKPGGLCLNLAVSVLLIPVAFTLFKNLDSIVSFITENVMIMLALGFLGKLSSKIIFALAVLPIGTLYKLVHALIPVRASCCCAALRPLHSSQSWRLLRRATTAW